MVRSAEITADEYDSIKFNLQTLWSLSRSKYNGTMWRVEIWKRVWPLSVFLEENKLNGHECKSFFECLLIINNSELYKSKMVTLKKKLISTINFNKLFKGSLRASQRCDGFDPIMFIKIWKNFLDNDELAQRYLNLL